MSPHPAPASGTSPARPTAALVFWVLWAAMTTGVLTLRMVMPSSRPDPATVSGGWSTVEFIALGALGASQILRWFALPRLATLQAKLPVFIVACAAAEACCILGIFVSPAHGRELFVAGLVGLALLAPLFVLPRGENFPRGE